MQDEKQTKRWQEWCALLRRQYDDAPALFEWPNHGTIEDAYHGTERKNAGSIQRHGFRVPSPKSKSGWLGRGIYFFESNPIAAKRFSERVRKHRETVVLQCTVEVKARLFYNQWFGLIRRIAEALPRLSNGKLDYPRAVDTFRRMLEEAGVPLFRSIVWHCPKRFMRGFMDEVDPWDFAVMIMVYDPGDVLHDRCKIVHVAETMIRRRSGSNGL